MIDLGTIYTPETKWDKGFGSGGWDDFYNATVGPYKKISDQAAAPLPKPAANLTFTPDEIGRVVDDLKAGGDGFVGVDFGELIGRFAIIVLGFIFVAAGLAMFRPGLTAESFADGVARNAAIV